jgi:hypothetical protein
VELALISIFISFIAIHSLKHLRLFPSSSRNLSLIAFIRSLSNMYFSTPLTLASFAVATQAFTFPSLYPRAATCPAVWKSVSTDLSSIFVSGLTCTDDARAAIRAVFHDCFPQGGCDGSISIPAELSRPENSPMTSTINKLKALAVKHNVGVADMLMFAGSHAVISCPGGPTTKTYVGRTDATVAAPTGQLPPPNVSAAEALSHFQAAGFTAQDLAALIGAHTASRQFNTDPSKAGAAQDITPGIWVRKYLQFCTCRVQTSAVC